MMATKETTVKPAAKAPVKQVAVKAAAKKAPAAKKVAAKAVKPIAAKAVEAVKATDKHAKKLTVAWQILVEWQGGSQAELARVLGVTRVAVQRWKTHGAVGRESAFVASLLPGCPLTFEAIRPDIKNLDPAVEKGLRVHAKTCIAYIKARDKERADEARAVAKLLKAQK